MTPRVPTTKFVNDKSKNKRISKEPARPALGLQANVREDLYQQKKASPPKKAYTGKTKRQDPKDLYKNPTAVGSPVTKPLLAEKKPAMK